MSLILFPIIIPHPDSGTIQAIQGHFYLSSFLMGTIVTSALCIAMFGHRDLSPERVMELTCQDGTSYEARHYLLACYVIQIALYPSNTSLVLEVILTDFCSYIHLWSTYCVPAGNDTQPGRWSLPLCCLLPYKQISLSKIMYGILLSWIGLKARPIYRLSYLQSNRTAPTRQHHAHGTLELNNCSARCLWGLWLSCFTRGPKKAKDKTIEGK